jgi:dTDP-4-amino-4,6-dideoxygalactose transaminase
MFQIVLSARHARPAVIATMREQGIGIGVHYPAIHLFKLYRALGYREGQFPHTERIARAIITLPLFPAMQDDDIDRVCEALSHCLGAL